MLSRIWLWNQCEWGWFIWVAVVGVVRRRRRQMALTCVTLSWTAWRCAVLTAPATWTRLPLRTSSSAEAPSTWPASTSASTVWPPSNDTASSSDDSSSGCSTSSPRFACHSLPSSQLVQLLPEAPSLVVHVNYMCRATGKHRHTAVSPVLCLCRRARDMTFLDI